MVSRGGVELRVDTADWKEFSGRVRVFAPKLLTALRAELRGIGNLAADAVKKELSEPTPEGNPSGPGREALIAGTRVQVSFAARGAGVKIITSGRDLSAAHAALLKVYNMGSFRHPVFGTETWVEEQGHPYFERAIEKVAGPALVAGVNAALDEAIAAIGGRL